jgi:predicted MFS family arabinose efflux permease
MAVPQLGSRSRFSSLAIAIDFGVRRVASGRRAILALAPEARGRLNGVYIATFFAAGALGSAVGAWAYAKGGWLLASRIGLALPLIALARFVFRAAFRRG